MTIFDFTLPDASDALSSEANLVYGVGMLASRAAQVTRTLCNHPDGRSENDAEHSFMLGIVAVPLAEQYYPELDSGLVAKYALVHDLVEAYVGDTPTYDIDEAGLKTKVDMEQAGRQQLKKEYLHLAPSLVALVEDYEEQASPEARFVRIVDKLMPTVIQFADDYAMTRESFTRETHQAMTQAHIGRFLEEYADQRPVLDLYQELAAFMRDRAWPD